MNFLISLFKKYFFTGLLTLLPLLISIYIAKLIVIFFIRFLGFIPVRFITTHPAIQTSLFILNLLLTAGVITFVGYFTSKVIGKKYLALIENKILGRVPVIKSIYFGTKELTKTLLNKDLSQFNKVVLMEYPRKGIFMLGFITSRSKCEVHEKTGRNLLNIFIPTTPNPTSGFLAFIPEEDLTYLDMSVEDGMKMVISGGIVVPGVTESKKDDSIQGVR